jgi:hypothetical protein
VSTWEGRPGRARDFEEAEVVREFVALCAAVRNFGLEPVKSYDPQTGEVSIKLVPQKAAA